MQCYVHNDRSASGACVSCGNLVCDECTVSIQNKRHCKKCLESGQHVANAAPPAQPAGYGAPMQGGYMQPPPQGYPQSGYGSPQGYQQPFPQQPMYQPQPMIINVAGGASSSSSSSSAAVANGYGMVQPKKVNHLLHLILSVLTGGLWIPVWILVSMGRC